MKKIITRTTLLLAFLGLSSTYLKAQYVTIPDANFVTWLTNNYPGCMSGNLMDTTCSEIVNETSASPISIMVSDLTGIEYFDSLQFLACSHNFLTGLPRLPSTLKTLICSYNNGALTSLPDLPYTLENLTCINASQLLSIPSLPNSLKELTLTGIGQIVTLPNLPNSIAKLNIAATDLTSLPTLPDSLKYLRIIGSQITNLPSLPDLLTYLECENNQLTSLPTLPVSLNFLDCSDNSLTSLPALPNTIDTIYCFQNQLTSLPVLPDSLIILDCRENQLSILPLIPNSLYVLDCRENQLLNLPPLSSALTELYCQNNQLTNLPLLPSGIWYLECYNNQLTSLPELPEGISILRCDNNNITCFPVFPFNLSGNYLIISNNPFTCLPNYLNGMDSILLAMPVCQANDPFNNPNNCPSAQGILGNIYSDNNNNCFFDGSDMSLKNVQIKFYNQLNNQFGSSNSFVNGAYFYHAQLGAYTVLVDTLNKPYNANCIYPGIDTVVVTSNPSPLATDVNFDIACKSGIDVGVQSVIHSGNVFPGLQHTVQIVAGDRAQWYGLSCAGGSSGQVQVTITGAVSYNGVEAGTLSPVVTGNIYTYNIADFGAIDNTNSFKLFFTTDTTAQAGDQICIHVEVTPITGDIIPTNNVKDYCYSVVNSYDPNYKEVYPNDVQPGFQDWLTYTVHFQNLGNAPAINIRLSDTLDTNLDAETFEVINYSHYNTVTLMNEVVDFRFPNILLPDSASNPTGSQGFVQYRIKPKANLIAGTQIENTAHIYFDYNPAVVTNTTVNNFSTTVNTASLSSMKRTEVMLYPNPGNGMFTISSSANIDVYNLIGELILSENNTTSIDLTHQPKGIYFAKLNGSTIKKLIKN